MLATAVIVFRETLEAALVVSIVLAATKGVVGRGRWVGAGIVAGILGALLVAAFAGAIADAVQGDGQELFDASILFIAVLMLAWHSIWMGRHGREIARDMNAVGHDIARGSRPLYALAVVVGVAVLREGSETVLFLAGIAASGTDGVSSMAVGGALGLAMGAGLGAGMYFGLVQIPLRALFTVTTWLVSLLAAGMASQGAAFLVQAGLLPSLGGTVWNSSWLLTDGSLPGRVLHTLVGYTDRPMGIQLLCYLATLGTIVILTRMLGHGHRARNPATA